MHAESNCRDPVVLLPRMKLELIFLTGSLLLHNVGFTQAMGQPCTKTLLVREDYPTDEVDIPPCENFRSCCSSEEQNITTVSPTRNGIDITARGNYMDVHVNLQKIDNQKILVDINYTYICVTIVPKRAKGACQGKGPFQQQMSLTIEPVGVNLELLECPNCTGPIDGKVIALEGTLMKLRCSTNLTHTLQYWMKFKREYNTSTESRIAYCSPHNAGENKHETGDAHWSIYHEKDACILKVEQCDLKDIGTYTCAVLIPSDTNTYEPFMSKQKQVVDIKPTPPVPAPEQQSYLIYMIALSIVAGVLLCITAIVLITSVWCRKKHPHLDLREQHQEQLRQHDPPAEDDEAVPLVRRQNGAEPEVQYGSIRQQPGDTCLLETPKLALGQSDSGSSASSTASQSTRGEH